MIENIILYTIIGTGLFICTITDLKSKQIYLPVVVADSLLLVGYHIWQQDMSVKEVIGTVIIIAFFLSLSLLTKEQIGLGDVLMFAMTGIGLGVLNNIFILMICFAEIFMFAIILVVFMKKSRNYRIPVAPFLLLSFVIFAAGTYYG